MAALAGIVVFRSINLVITPPAVSMPNDKGATSNNTKPPSDSPASDAACTAAPNATASSGFRLQFSVACCELLKNPNSFSRTLGTRVDPPTNTISSTSFASTFASFKTRFGSNGPVEQRIAQALELRSRDVQGEVLALEQGVHIYRGLRRRGKFPLRAVAGEVEAPSRFWVEPGRVRCALLLKELGVLLAEVLGLRWMML